LEERISAAKMKHATATDNRRDQERSRAHVQETTANAALPGLPNEQK